MNADFKRQAANARQPVLSPDLWSREAHDMVRIAIFAGFDAKILIVGCLKSSQGQKVNIRTVEKILSLMQEEDKE